MTTRAEVEAVEKAFRKAHPRSEWQPGYVVSGGGSTPWGPRPRNLYLAYQNRETEVVEYLRGTEARNAGPKLTRKFQAKTR